MFLTLGELLGLHRQANEHFIIISIKWGSWGDTFLHVILLSIVSVLLLDVLADCGIFQQTLPKYNYVVG